jgi:hypothetical protein
MAECGWLTQPRSRLWQEPKDGLNTSTVSKTKQHNTTTQHNNTMTKNEFYTLCSMLYILADEALKNPRVLRALRNHEGYDEIAQILQEEFEQQ